MKKLVYKYLLKFLLKSTDPSAIKNESFRKDWVISKLRSLQNGISILDAGAGEQQYKKFCDHLRYTSQDIAEYDGKGNDTGLHTEKWDYGKLDLVSDITNIHVADSTFDAVLCTEVIEHIPEPTLALTELHRVLKPGGKLILTAPFNSLTHFAPFHYSTGFSKYYYEYHLGRLGFKIHELIMNGNYFNYVAQELLRLPSIAEKYSGDFLDEKERTAQKILLSALQRFSDRDKGSNDLQCFGLHVIAEKI